MYEKDQYYKIAFELNYNSMFSVYYYDRSTNKFRKRGQMWCCCKQIRENNIVHRKPIKVMTPLLNG